MYTQKTIRTVRTHLLPEANQNQVALEKDESTSKDDQYSSWSDAGSAIQTLEDQFFITREETFK